MDAADSGGPLAGRHVLLGVSGGIAAYKAAALARSILDAGATCQAVLTAHAARFLGAPTLEGLTGRPVPTGVLTDAHRMNHVSLAREADVALLAPATANLLAKAAHGLADDLLSSTYLCLTCPVVAAPAMHAEMWRHPATRDNVETLRARGVLMVGPDEGPLAGGDVGPGRLADPDSVLAELSRLVRPVPGPWSGRRIVVTAGGTREPLDPVRFLGNRSSGKMGYRLAEEAARRGATVDLVSGPTVLPDPPGVSVHRVERTAEMREVVLRLAEKADAVIKAAAVADFEPAEYSADKLHREAGEPVSLSLVPTPDILGELATLKRQRAAGEDLVLVGFAADTQLDEARGRQKLVRKGLDLLVVNEVGTADAGFDVDAARAVVLTAEGGRVEAGLTSKAQLATLVCGQLESLLAPQSV